VKEIENESNKKKHHCQGGECTEKDPTNAEVKIEFGEKKWIK
jgi:hypothetical protein